MACTIIWASLVLFTLFFPTKFCRVAVLSQRSYLLHVRQLFSNPVKCHVGQDMRGDFYGAIKKFCTTSRCCQRNKETHRNRLDFVSDMQRLVQLDTKGVNDDALNNEVTCTHIS